jgi:diaminopimelate decarboxylase
MPLSDSYKERLYPLLPELQAHFGTPFHIYDEAGIKKTGNDLNKSFSGVRNFREYYAVKALPNPAILKIMAELGFGFDCSSITELILSRQVGAGPDDLMFTSNNTSPEEFAVATADGGSILNLDDINLIDKVKQMPETICFRYNPGGGTPGQTPRCRPAGDPRPLQLFCPCQNRIFFKPLPESLFFWHQAGQNPVGGH